MKTAIIESIGVAILGLIIGCMFGYGSAHAQTYQMTNPQGYSQGTIQVQGNTAQFVNPQGYTRQTATIYPNQIVITNPQGVTTNVIGNTGYTVPSSPRTTPTIKEMQ